MTLPSQLFELHPSSGVPIYRQLVDQVRALLAGGKLRPGDLLPSVRQVAQRRRNQSHDRQQGLLSPRARRPRRARARPGHARSAPRWSPAASPSARTNSPSSLPPFCIAPSNSASRPTRFAPSLIRCSPTSNRSPPPAKDRDDDPTRRSAFTTSQKSFPPKAVLRGRRSPGRARHGPRPARPERQRQKHAH